MNASSGLNYNFGAGFNYNFGQGAAGMIPGSYMPPAPTYTPTVAQITPASGANYAGLAAAANQERQAMAARDAARQQAVVGGFDQQMLNSRNAGNQAYQTLAGSYDQIAADAAATRARNMGRIDQYGNSMRQDLDIKARQAMAAANQSAIKRGLGNTTILNSLERGAAFDNTRQRLTLEDQLLQNRIATDSSLSSAYQNVLQNRATGLNSQANQNIGNDNQLATNRLGYIGGIQENMDGFRTVADLYSQGFQMANQNEQADLDRLANNPYLYRQRLYQSGMLQPVQIGVPRTLG